MSESIHFPEKKITKVVALIRRGLVDEKDPEIKSQFKKQCKELEDYVKRLQEDE